MRIFSFISLVCVALFLPFWVFAVFAVLYGFMYDSYELLILAVLVDALFADPARSAWYVYTIATAVILVLTTLIKPHLRFYK